MAETRVNDRQLDLSAVDQAVTLNNRLTIDTVQPELYLRANTTAIDTDGLYRAILSGGFFLHRNKAVAGDFSDFQEFFSLSSEGDNLTLQADVTVSASLPNTALTVSEDLLGAAFAGALLEGASGIQLILSDGSLAPDAGGLFRINIAPGSGQIDIEANTAMDGDFSTSAVILSLNQNGVFPYGTLSVSSGAGPAGLQLEDTTEAAHTSNTLFRDSGDSRLHWKDALDADQILAYETTATDTFTTADLKTVTVVNGIITSIV